MAAYVVQPVPPRSGSGAKKDNEGARRSFSEFQPSMDGGDLEETVRFIREQFKDSADRESAKLDVCKFHTALAFNVPFARSVLQKLAPMESRFAVTALVADNPKSTKHFSWAAKPEESFQNLEIAIFETPNSQVETWNDRSLLSRA
jgi:hypothetical protein